MEQSDPNRRSDHPEAIELLAHPDHLVSHIKTMRADGDFRGAAALLREALHQNPGNSEIRGLLAQTQLDLRFCDEKRAWIALVSETRQRVEKHVERGELAEAEGVLAGVEGRHGVIEELGDLKDRLQTLRRERELAEMESHLIEAQRLRDQGFFQESVWQARQALALDPQNSEATNLANSLILEIEEGELEEAVRRDAARIGNLLGRGRLVRAGLLIRNSRRKFGNLPALQAQLQRRRRLRTTRWVGRWDQASHTVGAPARWIRSTMEGRDKARMRLLIARLREQKRARLALISETRARIGGLVEQGQLAEAETVLARVESQHGAIEELEELTGELVVLRRELETVELSSHLREAERLRDEDRMRESLGEARQALALDSQDHEVKSLVDSLVGEIEGREHEAASRRDAIHIDELLERGRLLRAELWIKRGLREYGSLPVLRDQLQRCRRLRTTRWANRRILASHAAGAPALWIRQRVEELGKVRMRNLIARLREEKRARGALVAETRVRVADYVERGEISAARAVLAQIESRQGAVEGLEDWKDYLQGLQQNFESEEPELETSAERRRQLLASRWASFLHSVGALTGQIRSRLEERRTAWRWVLVSSLSLIVIAVAAAFLADFRVQPRSDASLDRETAAVDPQPAVMVAASGDLILDALPWGRVVAIVGQEGEQQELGESLFTPVRRSLPAGSYRVVLENPAVEEPAEFWVQVVPSGVTTKVHEFKPFDADVYFGQAWQ